mmetsp:Transcript_4967/g.12620  ORF Transcript_4967/g.12620 Transcript_4967/m.12620 type:complete len:278 (-) Transcript_4967:43-876(-)
MGKKRDRSEDKEKTKKSSSSSTKKKSKKIKVGGASTTAAKAPIKQQEPDLSDHEPQTSSNESDHQTSSSRHQQRQDHSSNSRNGGDQEVDGNKPFFFKRRVRLSLSLLPSSLHNAMASIENCFRRMLLRYDDGLKGMMVAYDDIQIEDNAKTKTNASGHGWILNELPYIHYSVSCMALVFAPSVGCELQGVVSQCFASHLSILVYGYVNAMIPSSEIREAGYVFDHDLETWSKQGGSQSIAAGNKVNFLVEKVHECDGTLSMEGVQPVRSLLVESTE